jgi:hypothetical protein
MRGKVLGCLVSLNGIKANPNKIRAIIQMKAPQTRKDVQKLTFDNSGSQQIHYKACRMKPPFLHSPKGPSQILNGAQYNNSPSNT